jgi:hypothetical protein
MNATIENIVELAVAAPSADNSQPWGFFGKGNQWQCKYHHFSKNNDPFGPVGHANLLATAALHQHLEMILSQSNCKMSFNLNKTNWTIDFDLGEEIPSFAASSILGRHTNRHPFRDGICIEKLDSKKFSDVTIHRILDPERIKQIANAICICSKVRFNDQELHKWLFGSLRFTENEVSQGDGLDLRTLPLPPGGISFMRFIAPWPRMAILNKIGMYRLMAILDSQLVVRAPALLVLSGPNSPDAVWSAGKALETIWIDLNRQGLAVHPYYVVTDIISRLDNSQLASNWKIMALQAKCQLADCLNLENEEKIHMILRVGYPTKDAVRSKRRATNSFINP